MRCVTAIPRSIPWFRIALAAAVAFGVAGCSSDTSRFGDGSSGANGARPSGDITASGQPKASGSINSTTLPPPSSQPALLAAPSAPAPRVATDAPVKPATGNAPAVSTMPAHIVVSGDTLSKIARHYRVTLKELVSANNITANAKLKLGGRLVIPGSPVAQSPASPAPPKQLAGAKPSPPASNARKITPAPEAATDNKNLTGAVSLSFRWPVRGRVIAGFGPKPSGQENHGINFAVPEGTPIKAAEDGVVAYASNELKTYGNLVLIRHANGFVTAYAHASEILVKRDEVVKRGQVIAKSGQTGNVSTPQLHFEIRKGSIPVDPMPYLDRSPQA